MRIYHSIFLLVFCLLFSQTALAVNPVYKNFFGNAIKGYDPVAYFKEGKAVKGKKEFKFKWKNANWSFKTEKNKSDFIKSPEKYSPQFGGYCAWAVSQGYTASIDPDAWNIVDGKLYLNYSQRVKRTWSKDIPGNIKKGELNWPKILAEN